MSRIEIVKSNKNEFQLLVPDCRFLSNIKILIAWLAEKGLPLTLNIKRLASYKNYHKGERCFIIGNGPSLKVNDLDKLVNEFTFASNKIFLAFEQTKWRPTYYGVLDTLVADNNYEKINKIDSICFFASNLKHLLTPRSNTIYFDKSVSSNKPSVRLFRFSDSPLNGLYGGGAICYIFMQLAFYMGFQNIYLLGMDHHFTIPKKRVEYAGLPTNSVVISEGERNHFHSNYRKVGESWSMPKLEQMDEYFLGAKNFLSIHGSNIFNATKGGKLEIFNRVKFDRTIL